MPVETINYAGKRIVCMDYSQCKTKEEMIAKVKESEDYLNSCLLYTSDAADDMQCVELGGRPIIHKKPEREPATVFNIN